MRDISRRIEKAEDKVQLIEQEMKDRKVKLLEIQSLEGQDSIGALLLKLELEYGYPLSLADVVAMMAGQESSSKV